MSAKYLEELDESRRLRVIFDVVKAVLHGMGIEDATLDSVVVAPPFYDGNVLLEDPGVFSRFIDRFAREVGSLGYALNDLYFLTVRELCELHISDSYPELPSEPLSDEDYAFRGNWGLGGATGAEQEFPICFVLGCPRSGTTLFRTMLNGHDEIWAPGELSLAHFESMADRATQVLPMLRYSIIPEVATRLSESMTTFSQRMRHWEREGLPVSAVYKKLYDADPSTLIVDKSPAYSIRLQDLKAIGKQFTSAKFIHLIRNPHDVIRSFVKLQMYKNTVRLFKRGLSPYQMGEIFWFVHNANIIEFFSDLPAERKLTVRYEDLVSDPETSLTDACDFLDLPFDMDMVDPYKRSTGKVALGASDVHINSFDRVESRQPSAAFYPIGLRCQNLANDYGY